MSAFGDFCDRIIKVADEGGDVLATVRREAAAASEWPRGYEDFRARRYAEWRRSPWYQVGRIYARAGDPLRSTVPDRFFERIEFQVGANEGAPPK